MTIVPALTSIIECIELIPHLDGAYKPYNHRESISHSAYKPYNRRELSNLKTRVTFTNNILSYLLNKFKDDKLQIFRLKNEVEKIRIIASEAAYSFHESTNRQTTSEFVKYVLNEINSFNTCLLSSFEPNYLYNADQVLVGLRSNIYSRFGSVEMLSSFTVEKIVDFILAKSLCKLEYIALGGLTGLVQEEGIAKLIYDDSRIDNQFPVRVWLTPASGDPLLAIHNQLQKFRNMGMNRWTVDDLCNLIPMVLKNKRCLIIIDRFLDLRTCDDIKSLFSDAEKGGIVLFTKTKIVDQIVDPTTDLYWPLCNHEIIDLHHLIFGNITCPQELEIVMVPDYAYGMNQSKHNRLKLPQSLGTVPALTEASKDIDSTSTRTTSAAHLDENIDLKSKKLESISCQYFLSVRLEECLKQLRLELTDSSKKLKKMGIVGMAGIGKTTFAKMLYEDPIVIQHFDRRAWIKVSQSHGRSDLLVELLRCIYEHNNDSICGTPESDLEQDICRSLKRQRYLIGVDDLWSVADWNGIRRLFPDDNNGSRILFTSRQSNVINDLKCEKIHQMSLLDEESSWELMQKKVFGQDISPPELEDIGKQIAKKCQGLPLVIVVVAGVLLKITKKFESWKAIAESVTSIVMSSANPCEELFALSYNHLPCHLQSCFLYMGAFRESGLEIGSRSLERLWIAEGFIIPKDSESLEQAADECLKDLIDMNLVLTVRKRSNGKVKTCRLHDLLLQFCINQARKEKFLVVIKDSKEEVEEDQEQEQEQEQEQQEQQEEEQKEESGGEEGEGKRKKNREDKERRKKKKKDLGQLPSTGNNDKPCRLSFHCDTFDHIPPKSQAGAAFFTVHSREVPDILLYNLDFKLLIILDMIPLLFDNFPVGQISKLLLLKYLSLTASFELPNVLFKLPKLQTLIINDSSIKTDRTPALRLPRDFWQSVNLRHLQLQVAQYLPPPKLPQMALKHLQTLSKVNVASCSAPETFSCIRNLIKLVVCETMEDFQANFLWNRFFENLVRLSKLQKLKVYCLQVNSSTTRQLPIPCVNAFPEALKKLTLSRSHLPWEKMKIMGELPNLEVLKLRNYAFEGPEWETQKGGFQHLEYLLIENTDLQFWQLECDDCFPNLKRLVLKYCHLLEEIPEQIGDSPALTYIELRHCCVSAEESAKYIQKQQTEEYLHNIEVHIQSKLARNQSKSVEEMDQSTKIR